MKNSAHSTTVQLKSSCAGCGKPGAVPTISTPNPETALAIAFVDDKPRLYCLQCRNAAAEQRKLEREAAR
jgi:hypothetical protein